MRVSTLHLASKSDALVKLHVNDDYGVVEEIPVKNLFKISSGEESFTSTASYSNLHHCSLIAMFKHAPNKNIPGCSLKNRKLVTYCKNEKGIVKFSTDSELTNILEEAITERLMDDNDEVILHIFCKYQYLSPFNFDEATQIRTHIRSAATTAGDNAMRQMKIWVTNAHQSLERRRSSISKVHKNYGPEHDVMNDVNKEKDKSKPLEWASRLAQFFLVSEENSISEDEPLKKKKKRVALTNSVENTMGILLQGVIKTSELVSTRTMTAAEFVSSTITSHNTSTCEQENTTIAITSPTTSCDNRSVESSKSLSTQEEEDDEEVVIIFNPESTAVPSECKIIFDLHVTDSKSRRSSEDGQLVDLCDGGLSCSSNEIHSTDQSNVSSVLALSEVISVVISEVNSDDASWTLDGSQSCISNENHSTQSDKSLVSAFSVIDNDDASWDILENDE